MSRAAYGRLGISGKLGQAGAVACWKARTVRGSLADPWQLKKFKKTLGVACRDGRLAPVELGWAGLAGVFHQRPIGLGRAEKAGCQGKAKREGVVGGNDTEMAGLAILDLGASLDIDF
ncbi:hypothetical protein BY996DRAFT_6562713 [Phakopsora pachyrhizi]|nr:hypothetical protein BY996DRAFT_6562713 [Phakopsora pachyrhizi]